MEEGLQVKSELQNLVIEEPFKKITRGNITFGDILYTYSDYIYGEVTILKIGFIYHDKFYALYYSAQKSKFDDYLHTVNEIINSLDFYDTKLGSVKLSSKNYS